MVLENIKSSQCVFQSLTVHFFSRHLTSENELCQPKSLVINFEHFALKVIKMYENNPKKHVGRKQPKKRNKLYLYFRIQMFLIFP